MSEATPTSSVLPFFLSSFAWNFALGMTYPLVPLYAHQLGMSGVGIGTLVALPVVVQISLNLVGGAYTDRVGGRSLMLASFVLIAGAGAVFFFAGGFWLLLLAQLLMVMSRAMYWPASQTLGSEMPGGRSLQMGRLNAVTNVGQIAGMAGAGVLLLRFGFGPSFLVLAAMGALSFVLGYRVPEKRKHPGHKSRRLFSGYAQLIRLRVFPFAIMCAYISALPFSLSLSFYPILFVEYGYASDATGTMLALRAIGSALAGLVIARYLDYSARLAVPLACAIVTALSVGLIASAREAWMIGLLMVTVGLASGIMTLFVQMLISEISSVDNRGSALALGGLGWGLSHFSTPLAMGYLTDHLGILPAFHILGGFAFLWAIALIPMNRWALAKPDSKRDNQANS
ncbi:MAG: MFS transporter [Betaproteobacteria bacterium]|nr:MFS transporter [Betaproteobacteria bacterium]